MIKMYFFVLAGCILACMTYAQPQGFFLDDWQPLTIISPAYVYTAQTRETATATVTVDFNSKITKVSKYVYGNNGIGWAGKMNTDDALMRNIRNLNPHILRWPGGNLSNEYFWDVAEGKGPLDLPPSRKVGVLNAGKAKSQWVMTLDDYYNMLAKTNSTGCICVNYSYARYGTGTNPAANAAHYAANWVRYDKGRTRYWEIGNENFGTWEAGFEIDTAWNKDHQPRIITGELYGKHCRVFIDSMKYAAAQIGSDIKIGVVAIENKVTHDKVQQNWNAGMMPYIAGKADFLVIHSYYTPYKENSSVATILNSAANTKGYKDYVLKDLKSYAGMETLPVALTEWNLFAERSKQTVSYISGMHAALVLGELIKNNYAEATRWDLMNGWNNGDDIGLFASGEEPGVKFRAAHAPFYYMYYFQKFVGDHMVASTITGTKGNTIVAYASSFSSGQCGIVIINKGSGTQVVNVRLNDFTKAKSYYRYVLTGGNDNGDFSRKVYINGNGPIGAGGGPDTYASLKAWGTPVTGEIKFECPGLSVTYLLVTKDTVKKMSR